MSADPGAFFERAHEHFLAATAGTSCSADFRVGMSVMRLETGSGNMLARLSRAFAHLRIESSAMPDLTVCAWDAESIGRPMIEPAWPQDAYGKRGAIVGFNNERYRTLFDHGSNDTSMIDLKEGVALFWVRDFSTLPSFESAAPLRHVISWWAEHCGHVIVHAAAIARPSGEAVLLAGPGGAGKSTTALACVAEGWEYLGDDYCVVEVGNNVSVFSLYHSAKLSADSLARLELHIPHNSADDDKQILFVNEVMPDRTRLTARCHAIMLPRIHADLTTSLEVVSPAEALRIIAPSSIFQISNAGRTAFDRLGRLVRQVPVRRLLLGRELSAAPRVINSYLDSLSL